MLKLNLLFKLENARTPMGGDAANAQVPVRHSRQTACGDQLVERKQS